MLDKATIRETLAAHRDELSAMGVERLYLFGSFLRGEQKKRSDIDFVVDYRHPISLLDLSHTRNQLHKFFSRKVDVLTQKSIHPALRENILSTMEQIYED